MKDWSAYAPPAVTWSISPAVGTINAAGLYTAPATITTQQTVTVTAQNQADPTQTGTATVTLVPPGGVQVAVYGTGVSATGGLLADGAVDPHYQLVASADAGYPGPNAVAVNSSGYPFPAWLANGGTSKWVAPRADQGSGNAAGTYKYRTTFDLTRLNPSTLALSGRWAADNAAVMRLNSGSGLHGHDGRSVVGRHGVSERVHWTLMTEWGAYLQRPLEFFSAGRR